LVVLPESHLVPLIRQLLGSSVLSEGVTDASGTWLHDPNNFDSSLILSRDRGQRLRVRESRPMPVELERLLLDLRRTACLEQIADGAAFIEALPYTFKNAYLWAGVES
jgi:hypothetical protein